MLAGDALLGGPERHVRGYGVYPLTVFEAIVLPNNAQHSLPKCEHQ